MTDSRVVRQIYPSFTSRETLSETSLRFPTCEMVVRLMPYEGLKVWPSSNISEFNSVRIFSDEARILPSFVADRLHLRDAPSSLAASAQVFVIENSNDGKVDGQ